jgi:nucleoside-triphosphatase THEP1
MSNEYVELTLETPTSIVIAGPSGCGKTELVFKILSQPETFSQRVNKIQYHYGEWQKRFSHVREHDSRYEFIEGLPDISSIPAQDQQHSVIVIDDLMEEARKSDFIASLFTKFSHHRNITVIFLVQKFYGNSYISRIISGNAHVIILFKNPRDGTSVRILDQQMFPREKNFLLDVFKDATAKPHGYLVLNAQPRIDERMRVIGNMFNEKLRLVYRSKSN